jgi:hypothetical protein
VRICSHEIACRQSCETCHDGSKLVGLSIGSINIKIPINGSMDNNNRNKAKLTKYSLMK